ncbi:sulfotransferase 1C4-like [Panulirus ornatus]|uniref:sulfotransferase 1C4-like n=1 Tax=Panulirus ornatus TaxID=150431 RepID=UPI003A886DF7
MHLASGHRAVFLSGEELEQQRRAFQGFTTGLVRLSPGGWVLPGSYTKYADRLYNFQFRSSDVLVMSYPKSGTTWTQEIVWTMRNNPDLTHPKTSTSINTRSPFLECDMLLEQGGRGEFIPKRLIDRLRELDPEAEPGRGIFLQIATATRDPRTIKTHLPLSLLTPRLLDTTKVVYVARNPKDVCASFCHYSRIIKGFNFVGTMDDFVQFLVEDKLIFGPYWEHLRETWLVRNHPNMHFLFYEDLKSDLMTELNRLNTFLGTSLTAKQLQQVAHHTSFSEMKAREETADIASDIYHNMAVIKTDGGFFRKGDTGSWKTQLTAVQEEKIDQWTIVSNLDITFKYFL